MRKLAVAALGLFLFTGCDQVKKGLGEAKLPSASLARVDLLKSPSTNQVLGWGCYELGFGSALCGAAGLDRPRNADLRFAFDIVFDVENPSKVPIPLVETLLGFTAFKEQNLGSVCVSFCDPEDEACVPGTNVEGACDPGSATDVKGPEDLVPTVDELLELGEAVATGEFGDNTDWRVIDAGGAVESHIAFDLGIDPMMGLMKSLLDQSVEEFLGGDRVSLEVPYTMEGTLFFDVPDLDRYAIGFGPFDDRWPIRGDAN